MAGISVVSKTSSSVTLCLTSLDESWSGGTRTVYWYLADGGFPTESAYDFKGTTTISGSPSSGGTITFSGLEANTNYFIACIVYHGSTMLVSLTGEVKTSNASGGGSGGDSGGGETDKRWTFKRYTDQSDSFSVDIQFTDGVCYYIPITFANAGTAIFYSVSHNSAANMRAYLSRYTSSSNKLGEPDITDTWNDTANKKYSSTMLNTDFGFEYTVRAGTTYYLFVRNDNIDYNPGNITIHCVAPNAGGDYFEWSSAVAQGSPVKDVSHTEWNAFIDKIKAVLTDKKIGAPYSTMVDDCYLTTYNTELQGYPLTAQKFNDARYIIGSFVSTGIGDKTSNQSEVLASDFHTLENCLKIWQG